MLRRIAGHIISSPGKNTKIYYQPLPWVKKRILISECYIFKIHAPNSSPLGEHIKEDLSFFLLLVTPGFQTFEKLFYFITLKKTQQKFF